uniref:Neprosin PEP catalytic domain-containing protein n=1 Tax=Nicotiana tabacum TaxID=4097 RepID=A0A1S4DMQ9_TOBAC
TKYGDTYDCVNFYKQLAFDHPLLKNHDIYPKIKPILASTLQNSDTSAAHEANESSGIWLKERGCPFETSNNNSELKRTSISSQGYKLAIVQIPNNPNNKFSSAEMSASLWNPRIESQQHTACRLKIQKGSDNLQTGWRVDPTLYGDNKTRYFVHFQDLANGNWWLLFGESNEQVGFWPQRLFSNMASFATSVEWGGVAYSPPSVSEPPMGSNCFPIGDPNYDAYCRRLNILNGKAEAVHIDKTTVCVDDSDR